MSALANVTAASTNGIITDAEIAVARGLFAQSIWDYYNAPATQILIQKKVLFFSISLKWSDIKWLIVDIAGPEPVAALAMKQPPIAPKAK